jgi:hypothetical protein
MTAENDYDEEFKQVEEIQETVHERLFKKYGCHGFWMPEYATLFTHTLIELLKAKNDRRLLRLIGGLTKANR